MGKRCSGINCNKRLTITNSMLCNWCGVTCCMACRFPDKHSCTGKEDMSRRDSTELEKQLPHIVTDKLKERI